jgi:methylated-DNA-protein-cysteine methyltransferase related protein
MGIIMKHTSPKEEVWQIIAAIPKGKVATYGQIASLAGLPNHARFVGTTLKNLPKDTKLPWFRVVNAKGELSFPVDSKPHTIQKEQLEKEDVVFVNNRFSLRKYKWEP